MTHKTAKINFIDSGLLPCSCLVTAVHSFKKVEIYLHTKFRWDIPIHGCDKNFFQFRFRNNFRYRRFVLHQRAKFRQNLSSAELWRHIHFSRWRPAAILDLIWVILDHLRSAIVGLSLVLKFGLDPIYSFGDIAIFIFRRFGLKLPIAAHFCGGRRGYGHIFPKYGHPSF